jgi:hypothetical protein
MDKYSCGFADHVNEDDEKLNTFTIHKEESEDHSDHWGNLDIPTR